MKYLLILMASVITLSCYSQGTVLKEGTVWVTSKTSMYIFRGTQSELLELDHHSGPQPRDENIIFLSEEGSAGCFGREHELVFVKKSDGSWHLRETYTPKMLKEGWTYLRSAYYDSGGDLNLVIGIDFFRNTNMEYD